MKIKDMQHTYTMRDMVKMFRRVDELTRVNNLLAKELADSQAELERVKDENTGLTAQLDDIQGDYARQMTAPRMVPSVREYKA